MNLLEQPAGSGAFDARPRGGDAATWLSSRTVVEIVPIRHPAIDALGHHPTSDYAERFWLPVIGPSALWTHRRLSAGFATNPIGFRLDLPTLGREIGLGAGTGRNSSIVRTLSRLVDYHLAEINDDRLGICTSLPPLTAGKPLVSLPISRNGIGRWPIN